MRFEESLWTGADPLYAPCISRTSDRWYWRPPRRYVEAGWNKTPIRLDGDEAARAAKCRELTKEMVLWFGEDTPKVDPGTWQFLIGRYKADRFSPFQQVKGNTKSEYTYNLARWEDTIGEEPIANCTYEEIMGWIVTMQDNGRSHAYIRRQFTMLRIVVGYGVAIEAPHAARISAILGRLRLKSSPPRHVAPTRTQIESIVQAADTAGDRTFALGLLLQFEFALRAIDVRGIWLPAQPEHGGIVRNGRRWQDGLTWDMIDRDVTRIEKVISKTEDSNPDAAVFNLTMVPQIRARLLEIPQERRFGPVIVNRSGEPFDKRYWTALFRRHAVKAGVPPEIQMRDARAGAITEAAMLGADVVSIRDLAGHSTTDMTQRYMRQRSESAGRVVELRQRGSKTTSC